MGLFDLLFGSKRNITSDWQEEPWKKLELDLNNFVLNGCKLGVGNISYLSFLGSTKITKKYSFKDDFGINRSFLSFYFPEKGLFIECDENYIVWEIEVWFDDSPHNEYTWIKKQKIPKKIFTGKIIIDRKEYNFNQNTNREKIKKLFEKEKMIEDEEYLLSYENGDFLTDINFNEDGKLISINIIYEP